VNNVRIDRVAALLALTSLAAVAAKIHMYVGFHSGG
jgi:hypothetical protein